MALVLSTAPGPAAADVAGVSRDLERLRWQLAGLQPVQASDSSRVARFEIRLGQLEEELRRLTGRVEKLEFEQRQVQRRLDQLVGDLDDRLAALEPGDRAGADATRPAVANNQPVAAVTEPTPARSNGPPAPPSEGTLGTVPESALLDRPRPEPESATPPPRGSLSAQEQYDAAMNLLRAGNYQGAENGLALFLDLNPDHPLAANAAYWLGESHYVRKDYAAAAAAFARNYRTYGRDAVKAPDNLLKLGMSLSQLNENEKACLTFTELAQEFPDAPAHIEQALARERSRAQCI